MGKNTETKSEKKKREKYAKKIFTLDEYTKKNENENENKERFIKKNKNLSQMTMERGIFGDVIPVVETPKVKHKAEWLGSGLISIIVNGKSGSGKSYWIRQLPPLIENLDSIIILSFVHNPNLYSALENYCDINGINFFWKSDPHESYDLIEYVISNKEPTKPFLTIFDDFTQYSGNKDNIYIRILTMYNSMARNYGGHMLYLTQSYNNVPDFVLTNASTKILFFVEDDRSKREWGKNFLIKTGRTDFDNLFNIIEKNTYSYLMMSHGNAYIYIHNNGENPIFKKLSKSICN